MWSVKLKRYILPSSVKVKIIILKLGNLVWSQALLFEKSDIILQFNKDRLKHNNRVFTGLKGTFQPSFKKKI